eukprot:Unigene3729_Nuclearia_a/m.11384 Unigene3729_Nuclearia_a/g.11384  ORF Unigene3729_Nuclearia_a/g.11384 Unigene3729_Nuclearia_a/m.11384 type:complete len:327 (+) Unigene3729_Nuclearia_a:1367-2347(+)
MGVGPERRDRLLHQTVVLAQRQRHLLLGRRRLYGHGVLLLRLAQAVERGLERHLELAQRALGRVALALLARELGLLVLEPHALVRKVLGDGGDAALHLRLLGHDHAVLLLKRVQSSPQLGNLVRQLGVLLLQHFQLGKVRPPLGLDLVEQRRVRLVHEVLVELDVTAQPLEPVALEVDLDLFLLPVRADLLPDRLQRSVLRLCPLRQLAIKVRQQQALGRDDGLLARLHLVQREVEPVDGFGQLGQLVRLGQVRQQQHRRARRHTIGPLHLGRRRRRHQRPFPERKVRHARDDDDHAHALPDARQRLIQRVPLLVSSAPSAPTSSA